MNFIEYMKKRNSEREDKDNMYPVIMSDREALNFLEDYLLGDDYQITDPISNAQANVIVVHDILYKYSKRYRKEYKKYKKERRK